MNLLDYVTSLEADSPRIVAALEGNPDAPIPWCGDWTVKDCAQHVGGLHHIVAGVIEGRPTATFGLFKSLHPPKPDDPALGEWITEGTAKLVEQLRRAPIDDPCWTFSAATSTVAFWPRRSAHETHVHRWDVEKAAGIEIVAAKPELAADGVDEYFDVFIGMARAGNSSPGAGESVHVHCTDTAGEWFLEFPTAGEHVLRREHAKGDVAFRGTAEALLLYLWGHQSAEAGGVEIIGDPALAARWRDLAPAI